MAAVSSFAAEAAGVWKCTTPAQTLTIKQEDGKVSGTVQSRLGTLRIAEGKIDGNTVSLTFFVVLSGGKDPLGLAGYDSMAEEGQVTEINYKGTITGDELKIKVFQQKLDDVRELTFHKAT